jgi:hypothetical protein
VERPWHSSSLLVRNRKHNLVRIGWSSFGFDKLVDALLVKGPSVGTN